MADMVDTSPILRLKSELKVARDKTIQLERKLKQATMFGDVLLRRNRALQIQINQLLEEKKVDRQNVIFSTEIVDEDLENQIVFETVKSSIAKTRRIPFFKTRFRRRV